MGVLWDEILANYSWLGQTVGDCLRRHTGQSLDLPDHSLAVGQTVAQAGSLLPRLSGDLLVTFLLDLLVPHQVQNNPQHSRRGRLGSSFEQVQTGDLQRLQVEMTVCFIDNLSQIHVHKISVNTIDLY